MPELKDLDLYWNDNDIVFGFDKDRNEYVLDIHGDIKPVEKGSIDPMWGGCPLHEAERIRQELIEEDKQKK